MTAPQILVGWSHPGRFRSEAAFASFACPAHHRADPHAARPRPRRRTSPAESPRGRPLATRNAASSEQSAVSSSRCSSIPAETPA
ncbi:hypothetical protein [Streptomyces werraensis]|uniref:hypothetical protein n=1 Tax=Streptomyces werraensis TaxID=68284 RepID=UPI00307B3763